MDAVTLLFGAALSLWWVDPYGDKPYLPDSPPDGGVVTNVLSCAAAKGEIETISFSIRPERDMKRVGFTPSDLVGPNGARIPASASDFALVKVWYRAGGRWRTSWGGARDRPELINNLIIHDDDLIRVVESENYAKRTVFVRIDYPEGPAYVDMRKHGGVGQPFNHSLHPVVDPKKFVPFDLKKGRFQQYWFTWKVPRDAVPGTYRGRLAVTENGAKLGDIPVEIEVYPFSLPTPRTHYDTSQPFISAWMGLPSFARELPGCKQMDVAERKLRAVYRSCAEHNANCPSGPGTFKDDTTDDLAVRSLILMRQEGMSCRLLINGSAWDWDWIPIGGEFIPPEKDPQRYTNALERFEKMLQVQRKVYDKYLGHHRCYFSSADECGTWFNRISYGFWGLLHKYGFESWTDYGEYKDVSWIDGMNDVPASARHTSAWNWHRGGAKTVTYAGPFTGPADPDIWRRTKGLRYYYADFDGHHEYCFHTADNAWNDFVYRGPYSQFQMAYLTYDGLISTLAWEGVREGLDDIRYLSLLRLRCEAALKSSDPAVQARGRRHLVWMDSQDPEAVIDLFAFRREVARRAAEMIALVGEEPEETVPLPPPELPPHSDDLAPMPKGAERARRAADLAKRNRYDLAIPIWENVRRDMSVPPEQRFEAARAEANLQSEILRRDAAIATIEDTLKMRDIKKHHRVRLHLLRAKLLMTSRIFAEEFTPEQLDSAAAALVEALQEPGATHEERFSSSLRVINAFIAGYSPDKAIAFANARLEDIDPTESEKSDIYVRMAYAYKQKEDWDSAARMFRNARAHAFTKRRLDLQAEGFIAEKRGDWKTAVGCYGDEALTYGKEEKAQKKACVNRLAAVMAKLEADPNAKRKVESIEDLDKVDIELDE